MSGRRTTGGAAGPVAGQRLRREGALGSPVGVSP